jgi:hypothetical protein
MAGEMHALGKRQNACFSGQGNMAAFQMGKQKEGCRPSTRNHGYDNSSSMALALESTEEIIGIELAVQKQSQVGIYLVIKMVFQIAEEKFNICNSFLSIWEKFNLDLMPNT